MSKRRHENGYVYAGPWVKKSTQSLVCDILTSNLGDSYVTSVQVDGWVIVVGGRLLEPDEARTLAAVLLEAAHIAQTGELPVDTDHLDALRWAREHSLMSEGQESGE